MISFNVSGCCTSRDILNPLIERGVQVLQYPGFVSPVSMFSDKGDCHIELEDMKDYKGPNFYKRLLCFDINKYSFDYLLEKKSDYLLVDVLAARFDMLRKGNHLVSITNPVTINRERLNRDLGFDKYERITPFDISIEEWNRCIDKLSALILKNYTPNQIILHKYYMSEKYADGNKSRYFSPAERAEYNRRNELVKQLDARFESNLRGCHIIHAPKYAIADKSNQRGLHPLHFNEDFYKYGAKALTVIMKRLTDSEEKAELEELRLQYQEKFKIYEDLLNANNRLEAAERSLYYHKNVLGFANELVNDIFEDEKFTNWLKTCANDKIKAVVLKANDMTGKILLKAMAKYGVEVILKSEYGDMKKLSPEELELCRKADMIICADVHSNAPVEYEEMRAVRIMELIRGTG